MNSFRFALLLLLTAGSLSAAQVTYQNPVRAGDYPDPSVIRVDGDYWATATSSEWAPHFPILHSRDLVNWEIKGYVFAEPPKWAKANFWAPEISQDHGKYFVYYTARSIEHNRLAVAVATADRPQGPWTDHGPLVSQDAGSIDAMPFTDAKGQRWLVWKEDGNSKKRPTQIWLQRLSADGLKLVGEIKEIMRNDADSWEGNVVEGPFVLRRGDWYYLFYSGNACCGAKCDYKLGVARAKDMEGPWEKCPANPLLPGNDAWRCPGHGSIVADPTGRLWLLYHSYAAKGFVATGREMLLDEVVFGADGWPSINGGKGPSVRANAPATATPQKDVTLIRDDFSGSALAPGYQWPIGRAPKTELKMGALVLHATDAPATAVQSITVSSFVAETAVKSVNGSNAGIVVFGDQANHLALVTDGKTIRLSNQRRGQSTTVAETPVTTGSGETIKLRVACVVGNRFRFAIQDKNGKWQEFAAETDGSYLPPWDRGLRTGVYVAGPSGTSASFDYFSAIPGDEKLFQP
jgi:beta-xylosidase